MNILLDVLAYNTHYQSMNANLMGNEMFLDTAQLRSSVVSRKLLGYKVRSSRAPKGTSKHRNKFCNKYNYCNYSKRFFFTIIFK